MSELSKQAYKGNLKEVKRIIESDEYYLDDIWAISCAMTKKPQIEIVKYLVDHGLPVQKYVLNQAVNGGNLVIVKFFIDKGYKPEEEDLDDAINNKFFDIADYLIDINCPISAFAIENAVIVENIKLVTKLMDKGANNSGNVSMSQAIDNENIKMVELLILNGKKIRKSHLVEAIMVRNVEMIMFIMSHLNESAFDQSVLQTVIDTKIIKLIKLFVNKINVSEDNISYAICNKYSFEIIELLIDTMRRQDNGSCISEGEINMNDCYSSCNSNSESESE